MDKGFIKLNRKEIFLLNKEIGGKRILSFYSDSGNVLNKSKPTCKDLKKFLSENDNVYALDGSLVKSAPSGPEKMYLYIQKHCISEKMKSAIREESFKLNSSVRKKVFERYGNICIKCGSSERLCIDHIFPVSRGGKTEMSNLQVLCEKCNLSKSNKII